METLIDLMLIFSLLGFLCFVFATIRILIAVIIGIVIGLDSLYNRFKRGGFNE